MRTCSKTVIASSLLALLVGGAVHAQTQSSPDQGRVISSTPIIESGANSNGNQSRTVGYTVTYEFGGHRYTTQMSQPPGATIPVQVSPMGVMTASTPQTPPQGGSPWQNVVPEAGMVVSGAGEVSAPYPQTTYLAPAYAYGVPVYAAPYGYGYGYASPFYAAPIGLSLNLGYSRGWGGGGWGGGRGRWR